MIKKYIPDMYAKDIFSINYEKLNKKNIKCLLIDLDNTISPAKEELLCEKTKKLFKDLKKDFKIILFSNNFKKRVSKFAEFYDIDYAYLSLKPFFFKYKYLLKKYNLKKEEVACVGDQLLTDIKGGNKAKFYTILVNPSSEIDEKETYFNRQIEKLIFKKFKEKNILIKDKYYD